MLRKFPPQTGFSKPQQGGHGQFNPGMQMMPQMMQGFPQQQMMPQMMQGQNMMPQQPQLDISKMDPSTKREFLGENLFGKITSNPQFASIQE